jgi:chromosome segregation ATPase
MKTFILSLMMISGFSVFAAAPVGQSAMKLDENPVRTARKSLESVDKEISALDKDILRAEAQVMSYSAARGVNQNQLHSLQAQATALKMRREQLISKRTQLQNEFNQSN